MDGKRLGAREEGEMFIPGIPDEIALEHVATKVSWRTLFALASVNRAWRRAIQEREVYNVRARTRSRETLVAFSVKCHRQQGCYDLEQQWMHLLPPLPQSPGRAQTPVGAVLLDGKLFVLGDYFLGDYACGDFGPWYRGNWRRGGSSWRRGGSTSRRDVYMLDLGACRLSWRPCSSTKIDTGSYLCVACHGKIYAFSMLEKEVHGEVYDPNTSRWSRIVDQPLNVCKIFSYDGRVACVNKEIYVSSFGEKVMVFNCVTEKWRELSNSLQTKAHKKTVSWVVIDEKLYNLSNVSVDVYDPASNTWGLVQPICYENFKHDSGITPYPVTGAKSGSEVLALLEHDISFPDGSCRKLCKSVGFGVVGCAMVWEVLPCPDLQNSLNTHNNFLLGSIEL